MTYRAAGQIPIHIYDRCAATDWPSSQQNSRQFARPPITTYESGDPEDMTNYMIQNNESDFGSQFESYSPP
jgi:hypothetical protein